eukprot:scaffold662667_cov50-Prasinocladus_malaysianus.AAC.1
MKAWLRSIGAQHDNDRNSATTVASLMPYRLRSNQIKSSALCVLQWAVSWFKLLGPTEHPVSERKAVGSVRCLCRHFPVSWWRNMLNLDMFLALNWFEQWCPHLRPLQAGPLSGTQTSRSPPALPAAARNNRSLPNHLLCCCCRRDGPYMLVDHPIPHVLIRSWIA